MYSSLNNNVTPTDEQRHEMLKSALYDAGRPEDYESMIRFLSPTSDITNIAAPGELRQVKIGIIGGGLAGMSAAYELRKLGAEITIFEASAKRFGGRVYTFYFDPERKYYGELGAMRIPISHETTWHYINLFGLNTLPLATPKRNNFLYVHNTRFRTDESVEQFLYPKYALSPRERATPWPELDKFAFEYRFLQLPPEIRSELIQVLPNYSRAFVPLMEMSLRDNFEELGLSQDAICLISGVAPTSGALLHISYDEIANERYTLDHRYPYRIQGGNVFLPLAFYNSFGSTNVPGYHNIPTAALGNVSYKSGHTVTGIYQSDYRNKVVVKYTNITESGDAADIFDYVICALPFSVLRTVEVKPNFSNLKMQAILEQNYIDSMKSLFLCNKRFWERGTAYGKISGGISCTDLPIGSILYPYDLNLGNEQNEFSSEEPGVLVASYHLSQNHIRLGGMKDSLRHEVIRQNVEEVHGLPRGFLTPLIDQYQTIHWNSEPLSLGALSLTLPGQKRLFAYALQQPEYNGRLYFAGEHISTKHGWMQGALQSGKTTANRIADHFHNIF